jgi:3-hydroxyacyl-CoA dehydrogenase/enoyl-CoA hydratase/3-hydroxybutyryl-CoA epimerase
MPDMPMMKEFRTKLTDDGLLHLIFDMPGKAMNVFTNAAIHEILAFAEWLPHSGLRGVVVRSGKDSAFCAGADLTELGQAYTMIMGMPQAERTAATVAHFGVISRAFRKLETAGVPVAAAIHGLALGGGCELAMGCHYRVMTDVPGTVLGLPESLVGLLPGGGGTQRLPRLVGLEVALPVLLDGARLDAATALAVGAADALVPPGQEVAAAEAWLRSGPDPRQPWERPDWCAPDAKAQSATLSAARARVLDQTGGHSPAEPAILDCLAQGLPLDMDSALQAEITIFARLVQRVEPRNMIATNFLGRVDYDRAARKGTLPECLESFLADIRGALGVAITGNHELALEAARFARLDVTGTLPGPDPALADAAARRVEPWFAAPQGPLEHEAMRLLGAMALAAEPWLDRIAPGERNLADHAVVRSGMVPSYLGGPFAQLASLGIDRARALNAG